MTAEKKNLIRQCLKDGLDPFNTNFNEESFFSLFEGITPGLKDFERISIFLKASTSSMCDCVGPLVTELEDWDEFKLKIREMFPESYNMTIKTMYDKFCNWHREFDKYTDAKDMLSECIRKKAILVLLCDQILSSISSDNNTVTARESMVLILSFQSAYMMCYFELNCCDVIQYINGETCQSDKEAFEMFYSAIKKIPSTFFCDWHLVTLNTQYSSVVDKDLQPLDFFPDQYKLIINTLRNRVDKVPLYRLFEIFVEVVGPIVEIFPALMLITSYSFLQVCPSTIFVGKELLSKFFYQDSFDVNSGVTLFSWQNWVDKMKFLLTQQHIDDCTIRKIVNKYTMSESIELAGLRHLLKAYIEYQQAPAGCDVSIDLHSFLLPYEALSKVLVDAGQMSFVDRYICLLYFLPSSSRFMLISEDSILIKYLLEHISQGILDDSDSKGNLDIHLETEERFKKTCQRSRQIYNSSQIKSHKWIQIRKEIKLGIMGSSIPLENLEVNDDAPGDFEDVINAAYLPMFSLHCLFCDSPNHRLHNCPTLKDFQNGEMCFLDVDAIRENTSRDPESREIPYPTDSTNMLKHDGFRSSINKIWSVKDE